MGHVGELVEGMFHVATRRLAIGCCLRGTGVVQEF